MEIPVRWFPLLPLPLIALLVGALAAALLWGTRSLVARSVPRRSRVVLATLRTMMIVVFAVGLLRPVVTLPRSESLGPDVVVLVDGSASMAQPAGGGRSRFEEVAGRLRADPALSAANGSHRIHWFVFDRSARPIDTPSGLDAIRPEGESTDFAASLDSAVQQIHLKNAIDARPSAPARVLLASDGLDQGLRSAVDAARELGVAVDVLPASTDGGGAVTDAAQVVDVQASERVLLGSETSLHVAVRADAPAEGLALVVEEEGREIARRPLPALQAGDEPRLVITHKPAEAGLKRYVARLAKGGDAVGSGRAVNVLVTDRRHDALLLDDSWRWDFKYLKRVFEDDPHFSLTAMLSRGNGLYAHFGEPDRRVQLGGFPRGRTELDGFETIVMGNVDPLAWPRGAARNLAAAVSEGGKSLVVIAGPNLAHWADVAELAHLLPVEITRQTAQPVEGKAELRLTAEGAASGWFGVSAGDDDGATPMRRTLPAVENVYPASRKRPAATVLVESTAHANEFGPLPVVSEHAVGRGRVLFLATDTLWQWQTLGPRDEQGVSLYESFWQRALRALAPASPTSVRTSLWLRPDRTAYLTRDRVRFTAELERRADQPPSEATTPSATSITATIVLPDGRRLPLDLSADARDPSRRSGWFEATTAGRHRIEATARSDAGPVAEGATLIEVRPRPGERDAAPVDAAALAKLAAETGGRIVDPASGWKPAETATTTAVRTRSHDLWQNFAILAVLSALFAADWSLRLARGYV